MRIQQLKQKEVINAATCKSLGCPADVDIDPCKGCITAIIIPGPAKFCGCLIHDSEYYVPWEYVRQVGEDIILVDIHEDRCLKKL